MTPRDVLLASDHVLGLCMVFLENLLQLTSFLFPNPLQVPHWSLPLLSLTYHFFIQVSLIQTFRDVLFFFFPYTFDGIPHLSISVMDSWA